MLGMMSSGWLVMTSDEILPHFNLILDTLLEVIDEKEPEATSEVFKTLAICFKFLSKPLANDLSIVRKHYTTLFTHKKPYIRQFAAESYSYLLRRYLLFFYW